MQETTLNMPHRRDIVLGTCLFLFSTAAFLTNVDLIKQYCYLSTHRQIRSPNTYIVSKVRFLDMQMNRSITASTQQHDQKSQQRKRLDFFIIGFPKCGTTSLVHAFANHNETDISLKEKCQIQGSNLNAAQAYTKLTEAVNELSADPAIQRGVKCPIGLRSHRALSVLTRHSQETKLIIGIRHPVRFLESHYNYRITELYDKKRQDRIPPIETLVHDEWMGVSIRNARFEIPLFQLGKTNMTTMEIQKLGLMGHSAVVPNKFQIFIYSLEQMEDTNVTRTDKLRHALESFMNFKHQMKPLGHENLNHFVGKKAYKETIDICDDKYLDLRRELIQKGRETQMWIRNKFLQSPDVTVANRNHFLKLLDKWEQDPCATTTTAELL